MFSNRLEKLTARRVDPDILTAKKLNEVYNRIGQSDSVRYVIGAMQSIDPEYTKNTYLQGERVRKHLEKQLEKCEFEYQGSVTNDTHIRARSDIDLLVITGKFITLEDPQKPIYPYKGDPIQDLVDLRHDSTSILKSAFPEAEVNTDGSKSIVINGGSLTRKIDVVPSNWFNSNQYVQQNKEKIYRGIQILDYDNKQRIKNTPFLHNAWINYKDDKTNGGLRKACRLMKSLKYDTEQIELSSYDIVSIAFNIPDNKLISQNGMELMILEACYNYCNELVQNSTLRESLYVPDQHRKIFSDGHATKQGLNQLTEALGELVRDVLQENARSFKKLAEARVDY